MAKNELKTLQDFYIIHDKLCVVLKKDTITYDLGLLWQAGVGSKVFLVIAKDPDGNGKHASSTAIVDLLEEKDVPALFKYEIADILANTIGDGFIVSKKSNFKDFIMQFSNTK